jgi:hypothetical protein
MSSVTVGKIEKHTQFHKSGHLNPIWGKDIFEFEASTNDLIKFSVKDGDFALGKLVKQNEIGKFIKLNFRININLFR